MATATQVRNLRRIIPRYARLHERLTYGTMDDAFGAAVAELDLHNYANAWALLNESLGQELQRRWRSMPNHERSELANSESLVLKLYNVGQVDRWELDVFRAALKHSATFTLRKCDLLAAFVRVFLYHKAGPEVELQAAPPAKPLPTDAEVAAERKRVAAERAEFLNRGDEIALPHWQAHHRALAAIGLCG